MAESLKSHTDSETITSCDSEFSSVGDFRFAKIIVHWYGFYSGQGFVGF